jgi:glycosyltransferase involved in cell wall biosynthesis
MTKPFVTIVVETISARENAGATPLLEILSSTLAAVDAQTYPRELRETIVVLDDQIPPATAEEIRAFPSARCIVAPRANYFAAKNAGAAKARGSIVAFIDGDCQPEREWVEMLVSRFEPGVVAVAGHTIYAGPSLSGRTFSVPDFNHVLQDGDDASGLNLNNVALRRDVALAHPLEERIRRDGGCFFLFHQLRAAGGRVVFEKRALMAHGLDCGGLGFVRKHFNRGYDGVSVYRLDDRAVLRGTRLFRRLGGLALLPITGRRIALDWLRLLRHRRQIDVPIAALPYYAAVGMMTRLIELAGGLTAAVGK